MNWQQWLNEWWAVGQKSLEEDFDGFSLYLHVVMFQQFLRHVLGNVS